MDEYMLKIAQEEYQRQYDEWLRMKPDQKSIVSSYEKLIEILEKYKQRSNDATPT